MHKRLAFAVLAFAAALARADEINVDINTPVTVVVKHSMEQRMSRLVRFYDAGIIGLTNNGDLAVRNASHLSLPQRQIAEKLVDADTTDRKALVAAIAVAHKKQKSDLPEVRTVVVKQWRERWKSGWYIQDEQGNWSKKP